MLELFIPKTWESFQRKIASMVVMGIAFPLVGFWVSSSIFAYNRHIFLTKPVEELVQRQQFTSSDICINSEGGYITTITFKRVSRFNIPTIQEQRLMYTKSKDSHGFPVFARPGIRYVTNQGESVAFITYDLRDWNWEMTKKLIDQDYWFYWERNWSFQSPFDSSVYRFDSTKSNRFRFTGEKCPAITAEPVQGFFPGQ